jgi:UDP-N-acetylmuramate dehydrogenase
MSESISRLMENLPKGALVEENAPLRHLTTLQAGGTARCLVRARSLESFAEACSLAQCFGLPHVILGSGSNVLISDAGFSGVVILNGCTRIDVGDETYAETGCWFQDLFLAAAQANRAGLEFAVGIPGTLGGALVSNAGAYRANIADLLMLVEIVESGERRWVEPDYLRFAYRDSILRRPDPPPIALLSVKLDLPIGDAKEIYDRAREYQRQRISKQPPHASAGSFFKNVHSRELADSLEGLTSGMRESGVVPAGLLIEKCGLKGALSGRAGISRKHANFICNLGGATASDIRALAELAKREVMSKFGIALEEEVLYLGDWSAGA